MLAREQIDYSPRDTKREDPVEKKIVRRKKVKKKKRKDIGVHSSLKLISMLTVLLLMAACIFFLIGYANIIKTRMEVTQLETFKKDLESSKIDLTAELEGIKSSAKIGEDAMYKLGMSYPQEGQIAYISVADEVKDFAKESEPSAFGKFFSMISNLF